MCSVFGPRASPRGRFEGDFPAIAAGAVAISPKTIPAWNWKDDVVQNRRVSAECQRSPFARLSEPSDFRVLNSPADAEHLGLNLSECPLLQPQSDRCFCCPGGSYWEGPTASGPCFLPTTLQDHVSHRPDLQDATTTTQCGCPSPDRLGIFPDELALIRNSQTHLTTMTVERITLSTRSPSTTGNPLVVPQGQWSTVTGE